MRSERAGRVTSDHSSVRAGYESAIATTIDQRTARAILRSPTMAALSIVDVDFITPASWWRGIGDVGAITGCAEARYVGSRVFFRAPDRWLELPTRDVDATRLGLGDLGRIMYAPLDEGWTVLRILDGYEAAAQTVLGEEGVQATIDEVGRIVKLVHKRPWSVGRSDGPSLETVEVSRGPSFETIELYDFGAGIRVDAPGPHEIGQLDIGIDTME
jgi:hypothetical protein